MMWTLVSMGVFVFVIVLVVVWFGKGKKKQPEVGPSVPNLTTAEDIVRIEELHDQGKMTDEEYHAAKARLLSLEDVRDSLR